MVDLSVDNVFEANRIMELRALYIAQRAALASLSTEDLVFKFDQQPVTVDTVGVVPWNVQFVSGATPGTADAVVFDALQVTIANYLDSKIAQMNAVLLSLGVTL